MSASFIDRYSGLTNYLTVNTISYKSTVDDFNHTGMGKEHPFDADDSIENLNMINKVIEMLNINLVK
jgi:uncharacterized membrane protein